MADISQILKDTAYVGVGLGIITFQRAQVRRQELQKQLEPQLADARERLTTLSSLVEGQMRELEDRLEEPERQLETFLDELEANVGKALEGVAIRLPGAVASARAVAREATDQLRARLA